MATLYTVIVGNIGRVHDGHKKAEALKVYTEYVFRSATGYGRAAGESVVLWRDSEPIKEFYPPSDEV